MMTSRRFSGLVFAIALLAGASVPARSWSAEPLPAQFELPRMKTSIYIGSVTLITGVFSLSPGATTSTYTATYEAKVSPWAWWSEAGSIALNFTPADHERLLKGETIELTGEAKNGKGKLRQISARAQPADATSGKIKVRIGAGGSTLIFNSTYRVIAGPAVVATTTAEAAAPAP